MAECDDGKRVIFVTHTAQPGGAEIALANLLPGVIPHFPTQVISGQSGPLIDRLSALPVRVEVVPWPATSTQCGERRNGRNSSRFRLCLELAGWAARLACVLKRRPPAIVYTNTLRAHVAGGLAGRMIGAPVVWHLRDRLAGGQLTHAEADLLRRLSRILPARIAAVSANVKSTLPPEAVDKTEVIYDGVIVPEGWLDQPTKPPRIVMMGRLAPWKGQHIFLAAVKSLSRRPPCLLVEVMGSPLFGEEDYEKSLRRQAEEIAGVGAVRFTGFIEEPLRFLSGAVAAVHASIEPEPFGQVIIEAMAAGVPVIASRTGGPVEIVEDGVTGLLSPPGDPNALSACLERLLIDPTYRKEMAIQARRMVAERFPIEATQRRVCRLLSSISAETSFN